jgi:hypothetical protein
MSVLIIDASEFLTSLTDLPPAPLGFAEVSRLVARPDFDSEEHRDCCIQRAIERAKVMVARGSVANAVVTCAGSAVALVRYNLQTETTEPVEILRFAEPGTLG